MSSVPLVGVACRSCSVGSEVPTTTIRPATRLRSKRPDSSDANEIVSNRPGLPRYSIQAPSPPKRAPADLFGSHHRKRLEVRNLVREARDRAAGVGKEVRGARARVQRTQVVVATEHVRPSVAVHLRGRQDHIAGPLDRRHQRLILLPLRRLGELDVVDDLARAGLPEHVDRLGVDRAPERPLVVEAGEREVVDRDDGHPLGHLGAAKLEAQRARAALDRAEGARQPDQQPGDGRERKRQSRQTRTAAAGLHQRGRAR
jgi:hypothetical protein